MPDPDMVTLFAVGLFCLLLLARFVLSLWRNRQ